MRTWLRGTGPRGVVPVAVGHLALALGAALIHRPVYMLTAPFWLDEAWVADSLRAPLSDLPRLTSSSPIGWTFLLRLVPPIGAERARLVPLLFTAALCPLAYRLGRELDARRRGPALVLAFAAAVLPPSMARHDLKQYTADAFVAVLLLLLAVRAERAGSVRALVVLTAVASSALLLSHTTALVAPAAYGGLLAAAASRRRWREAAATVVGFAGFLTAVGADYLVLGRRALTPLLRDYWAPYYASGPEGLGLVRDRAVAAAGLLGLGPVQVATALLLLGVAALAARGHRSLAVAVPLVVVGSLLASRLELYPLWEKRTGHYFYAIVTLVAAYGVVECASWLASRAPQLRLLSLVPVVGLAVALAVGAVAQYRPLPDGDTAFLTRHVAARRAAGEPVLVDSRLAYGWAYYWKPDRPRFEADDRTAVGFRPYYPDAVGIRVVSDGNEASGPAALASVLAASPTGSAWVALSAASRHDAYIAAGEELGAVTVVTDEHDYWLLHITAVQRPS